MSDSMQTSEEAVPPAEAHDPAAPAPLGVERVPTGDAGIDAHLERLADADHLPADGHMEVYEDVHRGLRDTLTALDARQGPPAPQQSTRLPTGGPHPTATTPHSGPSGRPYDPYDHRS
ncbi:hypothetical protein ACFU5O_36985 [Streptomyces sp. NPDC057445]|uniref:hypothetical protein n=1 Tax=Streptomyces sp. NPDC057445 TaxID=3346136 RepID=UPI0036A88B25